MTLIICKGPLTKSFSMFTTCRTYLKYPCFEQSMILSTVYNFTHFRCKTLLLTFKARFVNSLTLKYTDNHFVYNELKHVLISKDQRKSSEQRLHNLPLTRLLGWVELN